MRFQWMVRSILPALALAVASSVFSQSAPSAVKGGWPIVAGAGFSNYRIDFVPSKRESGGTLWVDWTIRQMPRALYGLGLEFTARDISVDPPIPNFRYDTAAGGAVYHYLRIRNVRPYAKFLSGYGSVDFPPFGSYAHDTRTFYAGGGGVDVHAYKQMWVRVDYEYQWWQRLFGNAAILNPDGFTIGPEFDFGMPPSH